MKEEDKNESLGIYLRRSREQQGFSLLDVSSKTKISVTNLEYLENEEFFSLPNEVFIKGFLRSYAKVLGLEETDVLERFQQWKTHHQAHPVSKNEADEREMAWQFWPKIQLGKIKSLYESKKSGSRKIIVNILIGMVVILAGLILFSKRNPVEDRLRELAGSEVLNLPVQEPLSVAPATSVADAPSTVGTLPATVEKPQPKGPNLHLNAEAIDRSWISVVIDDGVTKEFSLHPGDKISLDADKKFVLNIGNAGGVKVTLNGKVVGPFGKKGEIVKGIKLEGS